jgi:lysophospholipase L1-like esterase
MKLALVYGAVVTLATLSGCGSDAAPAPSVGGSGAGGSVGSSGNGAVNSLGGGRAGTAGTASQAGNASNGGETAGGATGPMALISRGVPAFASSGMAVNANDDKPNIAWSSEALPAWLAYDVSQVPAGRRKQVLLAWYCYWADYLVTTPKPEQMLPLDYVVETNAGAGGGQPPTDGWQQVAQVTANAKSARQHAFDLAGANWVRMNVTKSSDATKVMVDLDLYSAPAGGSDGWLFMGDSITYMTTQRAFSDLPALVEKSQKGRVPLIVDGALGGTNTTTAQEIVETSLSEFAGRYVVLAYGTNDHAAEFKMENLVQKVIARGLVPVVPYLPWADGKLEEGPLMNEVIAALYVKYPQILKGPDLWKAFENRTDLIPVGDVHPNGEGMEYLRAEWAKVIGAVEP